jgi:hypothetical protein
MLCPAANQGRRGGKPATNRLGYGTVPALTFIFMLIYYAHGCTIAKLVMPESCYNGSEQSFATHILS